MGKRGPKPTPTKVLEARGSWRARGRQGEPKPALALTDQPAPGWISKQAKPHWQEISRMLVDTGILTAADRPALALLCDELAVYIHCRDTCWNEGFEVECAGGWKRHPLATQKDKSWAAVLKMFAEFGLTPSSRSGIKVPDPDEGAQDKSRFFRVQ